LARLFLAVMCRIVVLGCFNLKPDYA